MMVMMMIIIIIIIVRGRLEPVLPSSVLGETDVYKTQDADVTADEDSPVTSAGLHFTLVLCYVIVYVVIVPGTA